MDKPIVVKIGGSTLGANDTSLEDIGVLQRDGAAPVVVHGGGAIITQWLGRMGVETRFVRGLRVTDDESLRVATAVLCGLVNKELVAQINRLGGQAVGLSGADGPCVEARVADPDLGLVGQVVRVNPEPIEALLSAGFVPVIAPIGVHVRDGSPLEGKLLNINADTVAGHVAAALSAQRLIFLTDVEGVLDASGRVLSSLGPEQARALIASGVARGGMIPKLEAALEAFGHQTPTVIIDGRQPHALVKGLGDAPAGTCIGLT